MLMVAGAFSGENSFVKFINPISVRVNNMLEGAVNN